MTRKIIGISGHAGAGKDTAAAHIYGITSNEFEARVLVQGFAHNLKAACAKMFGISEDNFSKQELKNEKDLTWGISPRQIAQFVGTELVRDGMAKLLPWVGKDFWVHSLHFSSWGTDLLIIPDVRFQNEVDWILENGGILIHLTREGCDGNVGIPGHASEKGFLIPLEVFHAFKYFELRNNGTKEELYEALTPIVHQYLSQQTKSVDSATDCDIPF